MGYLICSKCKGYYELASDETVKDFISECNCGGKLRYVENLDIVDPHWKPISVPKKRSKKEILKSKFRSVFIIPWLDLKTRMRQFYYNHLAGRFHNHRRQSRINRNPYGMDAGLINSVFAELNFRNIKWITIIPFIIAITSILAFTPGFLTLLTFLLLLVVGYLFDDWIIGTKNAIITGAISYFLGCLLTGQFLYLIPYTMLGVINGAVCGWIGGYVRSRI